MAHMLGEPQVLFDATVTGLTLISTRHRWVYNNNTLTVGNDDTVYFRRPSIACWHEIPVNGADFINIQWSSTLVGTIAGTGNCTDNALTAMAIGVPPGAATPDPVLRVYDTGSFTLVNWNTYFKHLACFVIGTWNAVGASPGSRIRTDLLCNIGAVGDTPPYSGSLGQGGFTVPDGTQVTTGDTGGWTLTIAGRQTANATAPYLAFNEPRISGFGKIYFAVAMAPELSAQVGVGVTGKMVATKWSDSTRSF